MTSIATPQLTAAAPSAPTVPVQLELSQTLGRLIGQIVRGTVTTLLNDTTLRLQTPAGLLDIAADVPLPPGTPVTIAVQGTAQQPQIVITPVADGSRSPPAPQTGVSEEASPEPAGTNTAPTNSAAASSTPAAASNSSQAAAAESVNQPGAVARAVTPPPPAAVSAATAIVRNAAAAQGSLATLYADVEAAVSTPAAVLPAPVLDAARLLLAMRFVIPSGRNVSADDVETAMMRAGLTSAPSAADAPAPATPSADLATALVGLRQALKTVLDQQPDTRIASAPSNPATAQTPARSNVPMATYRALPILPNPAPALALPSLATATLVRETVAHVLPSQAPPDVETASPSAKPSTPQASARANAPMPPYRGAPGVPQAPAPPSLVTTASPREQAIHLLAQTDAAIARQTLLRIASLPADQTGTTTHSNDNAPRLMAEIPVATAFGTAIAPMTIERDGRGHGPDDPQSSWHATFSIDLAAIGPVHVRIALNGERASVMLKAERPQSAELLAAGLPLLDAGLRKAEIEPGELRCLSSGPNAAAPTRLQTPAPGMFLDQAS
jgi:Flagellar hook-length control protein FliK